MSADSPLRLTRKGSTGHIVLPQPVSDPSIIDSVAGFIHEVIPQAYTSVVPSDSRESIAWARFEQADCNDASLFQDAGSDDCDPTPPLLLVLGYTNGVQVWSIGSSGGEAVEVLSWNQRVVRTLRFLPAPLPPPSPSTTQPHHDPFAHKRPLIALVDNSGPPPHFSTCSFISLLAGDQVKSIKFKNPICDVLANRRSIVITFVERIAVFDALTLEDRLTVTTCYPSPGVSPNPVALGSRWLAYADKRLVSWWRSLGGCDSEGGSGSYTASVLHAAKSLGKGLRGLSGHVASHLGGTGPPTLNGSAGGVGGGDAAASCTPGVVTVLDIQGNRGVGGGWCNGGVGGAGGGGSGGVSGENVVAHFVAHGEPVVALAFDGSGLLLVTVDRRGHRFHLFRIQPHLSGSPLTEVHQLYTLYRGDTTARIQDIAFSCDSRWVAVSSLRGTTHVFPITPYGGSIGVRTHTTPHVVDKLSRFHRSAGLSEEGGCGRNSPGPPPHDTSGGGPPLTPPLSHRGGGGGIGGGGDQVSQVGAASHHHHQSPVTVQPLAQLRRHYPPQPPPPSGAGAAGGGGTASHLDTDAAQVRVAACFAPPRASLPPGVAGLPAGVAATPPPPSSLLLRQRRPLDAIFVMSAHGTLIQYDLEPRHVAGVSKERISDDTAIELAVEAKAEWHLMAPPLFNPVQPPLAASNPLLQFSPPPPFSENSIAGHHRGPPPSKPATAPGGGGQQDEHWLSQVEIVTHAGPHRRLWMGPQFTFKTYNLSSSDLDKDSVEVGSLPVQSNPINVPMRPPLLIESGSTSSLEQSPHLTEVYQNEFEFSLDHGDSRLREDLADAMQESPSMPGRRWSVVECVGGGGGRGGGDQGHRRSTVVERRVNPLGTIIMVQPSAPSSLLSEQLSSRQSADHLIVVAAQSLSTTKKQKKNKNNTTQVPSSHDDVIAAAAGGQNVVVSSSSSSTNISNNKNSNDNRLVTKDLSREDVNEKCVAKSNNNNNNNNNNSNSCKERRKNAKNDRKSLNNVDKSIAGDRLTDKSSITSVDEVSSVDKSITGDRLTDKSSVDKSITCDRLTDKSSVDKSITGDRLTDKSSTTSVDELIADVQLTDRSTTSVDKVSNADKSIAGDQLSSITVDKSPSVDKSLDESITIDESIITVDDRLLEKSIGIDKSLIKIDSSVVDDEVGAEVRRRAAAIKNGGEEKVDDEVEVGGMRQEKGEGTVEDDDKLAVMEDRDEYPALAAAVTCSGGRSKQRKCRTLGKKISKVAEGAESGDKKKNKKNNSDLMEFPDLLLANVQTVVDSKESMLECIDILGSIDSRQVKEELIAQVVLETIEKDNLVKISVDDDDDDVEEITKKQFLEKEEEGEEKKISEEEEEEEVMTTDKDSSDDCLSKCCDAVKVSSGGGSGGGVGKKRKNRKKEERKIEKREEIVEEDEEEKVVEEEEPKKLSWSQIASMGAGKNRKNKVVLVEEEEEEEEGDVMIKPEIISWKEAVERDDEAEEEVERGGECKLGAERGEDRGSVYESCCESVEDGAESQQIEVANDMACTPGAVSSSEKESADSGEKELVVVGGLAASSSASSAGARKTKKPRKKRR